MALTYQESVEQTITAGEQIHQIVNGTATTEVTVEDGSKVPSIRKALLDNFYFKDPIAWQVGQTENVFNQIRQFTDGSWWYAPSATASNPISMGSTPVGDPLWMIYDFDAIGKLNPQIREALRRSYAEAGYNLVDGSFEAGGTLASESDVLIKEGTGVVYSWDGAVSGSGKVVPPNSTPETTGGVSAGAWVNRTDATLRSQLISNNQIPVTVSQFGGNSGFSNDSSDALIAFINAINSGAHEGSEFLIDGLYRTTKPLPTITKPCSISGVIPANSAILFDNLTDGLKIDLSSILPNTVHSLIQNFAILTNKTLAGTGLHYIGNSGANQNQTVKLQIDSMRFDSLDRFIGKAAYSEWQIGIHLGVEGSIVKPSAVRINNTSVHGSDANANWATLTTGKTCGVVVDYATDIIITNSRFILLSDHGVLIRGQSEGSIIENSQMVAVPYGITYSGTVNPANNHCIVNSHISPYVSGITFTDPVGDINLSTPIANYINNVFILERGDTKDKGVQFTGVDAGVRFSKFSNVTVWANSKTAGIHTKIGFRIARGGNTLANCHSHNMSYSLEIFQINPAYSYGVDLNNFYNDGSILGFLSPASVGLPNGAARGTGIGDAYNSCTMWENQFSLIYSTGINMFDITPNVISHKATTGATTNYRHIPSNEGYPTGANLIGIGGDAVTANRGNWILRSSLVQLSGTLSPEGTNTTGTIGTPGTPWAGGYSNTAFVITSDERAKTVPEEITDAMLDAAAEVDWCMFQYLDRVEEKGADNARWHFGAIAQRFVEAFERHGLDPYRFAFICYDEWGAEAEVIGEDGEVITPSVEAGSRYGIRYEQAIILKQKQVERDHKRQLDSLLSRIEALENK